MPYISFLTLLGSKERVLTNKDSRSEEGVLYGIRGTCALCDGMRMFRQADARQHVVECALSVANSFGKTLTLTFPTLKPIANRELHGRV
jgi:hypothetical protein